MEKELPRINTRMSHDLNEWLDKEAARTGLSKSAIVMMATENYRREKEALKSMADLGELFGMIEEMNNKIERSLKEKEE